MSHYVHRIDTTIPTNNPGITEATPYCHGVRPPNGVGDPLPSKVGGATAAAAAN